MSYKKIGVIDDISKIPFNTEIIVNGSVDKTGWMWHMPGKFKRTGNEIVFRNEHGMVTKVKDGEVNLTILQKLVTQSKD